MPEARELAEQVRGPIDDSGDVSARFMLDLAESGNFYAEGRFSPALSLVEKALLLGELVGDDLTRVMLTRQWRCDILVMTDRLDQCLDLTVENMALAQKHLQAWALRVFETGRARILVQLGRLADAYMILKEHVTEDSAPEITNALDAAAVTALAHVAIHTGDEASRRVVTQIAEVMLGERASAVCCHAVWILALDALANGNFHGAHSWLCQLGESERFSNLPLYPADMTDEPRLVRLALTVGDHDLAAHVNNLAEERAAFNPEVTSLAAAAAHTRGLLRRKRADLAWPLQLTFSRLDSAHLPRRPPSRISVFRPSTMVTQRALSQLSTGRCPSSPTLSATWDAARLRGRLRSLGVRRRLAQSPRHTNGWASLTDAEVAVARLVAQGLSNRDVASRLFVSYHTVSGHLRNVFTKLAINSRVELVRIVDLND